MTLPAFLFPAEPRSFPGRRGVKILLRAVHVLCAGTLTAAYLLEVEGARPAWLVATVLSGLAILALDLHESASFLLQVRGVVVLAKIALLAALPALGGSGAWLLVPLLLASVIFSHAPSKLRYLVLVGRGRVRGAETRG
jgi:hypothetical protein